MARGKFITDFERAVIRLGMRDGRSYADIARLLGRTRGAVRQHVKRMEADGTLGNLPLPFHLEELTAGRAPGDAKEE